MKNIRFLIVIVFSLIGSLSIAQAKQEILKPSEGKALIYFIRPSSGAFLIDFKLFHGDKFLGMLGANQYLTYECEPGENLFWGASENRDFVDAKLEANKVYVIKVLPQMGAFVAGVNLTPLSPKEYSHRKDFNYIIKKNKKVIYTVNSSDEHESAISGLEKYKKLKESNSNKILQLTADMNFINADKPEKI